MNFVTTQYDSMSYSQCTCNTMKLIDVLDIILGSGSWLYGFESHSCKFYYLKNSDTLIEF